ncbi:MAG: formate dehydrogenase subunit delta [Reinekea sp.]|jgi:formate dehydrogenase subunit delta
MSQHEQDRMIQMVNQIAINNISIGNESEVVNAVSSHIQKFWPRRMKNQLIDYIDQGGEGLHPLVRLVGIE